MTSGASNSAITLIRKAFGTASRHVFRVSSHSCVVADRRSNGRARHRPSLYPRSSRSGRGSGNPLASLTVSQAGGFRVECNESPWALNAMECAGALNQYCQVRRVRLGPGVVQVSMTPAGRCCRQVLSASHVRPFGPSAWSGYPRKATLRGRSNKLVVMLHERARAVTQREVHTTAWRAYPVDAVFAACTISMPPGVGASNVTALVDRAAGVE